VEKKNMAIPKQLIDMDFCRVGFKTKKPFENDWVNKPYTYTQISEYFPKENYGVICGEKLRVLDDDTKENILLNMFLEYFGETFRVRNHLYFNFDNKHSEKIIFFNEQGEHLGELQGCGTMVVGAGSTHPSGEIYEQKNDLDIKKIKYEDFIKIFGKYIKKQNQTIENINIKDDILDDDNYNDIKSKWVKGDRQNLALILSGYLRKNKRFGKTKTCSIIENICKECGDTDISERLKAVESTYNKDESEIKGISGLEERGIQTDDLNNFLIFRENKRTGVMEFDKVDIESVAIYIENKFQIRTIFGIIEETIEIYSDGIWTTKGKGIIKAEVERLLSSYSNNHVVNEVLEKVKRRTETSRDETENIPLFKRCLLNGVLDLENVDDIKLIKHSKEFNFRTKFNINYNPNMKCPNCMKFINETFYEEDIEKFQEFIGMLLIRKYIFKKSALFHGPKNTGKTVLLNLLTIFLNGNISGLSMQEIGRAKPFDLLDLKDKDANIFDDMSSTDMSATGGFKMSVGDGFISAEMKFGDRLKFRNTAKQIFACNTIPSPKNDLDDEAHYSRIILFPIENIVPQERQNSKLIEELTTPDELSGLLNWTIIGYKRLIKQNYFTNDKTPEETKFLMIQNGDSLGEFAIQVLENCNSNKVTKDEMYKIYCDWCINHKPKLSPNTKEKIGRNLTKFAPYTQASSNGSERYWLNVKIKDTFISYGKNEENDENTKIYDTYYTFKKNMSDFQNSSYSVLNDKNNTKIDTRIISKSVISVSDKNNDFSLSEEQIKELREDLEDYNEDL
jgi:putative DNA primase/helicase